MDTSIESPKQRKLRPWPWPSFTIHDLNKKDLKYFISLINAPEDSPLHKNINLLRSKIIKYDSEAENKNFENLSPRFGSDIISPRDDRINNDSSSQASSSSRLTRLNSNDEQDFILYSLSERPISIPIQPKRFSDFVSTSLSNPAICDGTAWKNRYFGGDIKAFRQQQWQRLKEKGVSPCSDMKIRVITEEFQTGYQELKDDDIIEGMVIDKYKIGNRIGRGAHSVVFSAHSIIDRKPVCIKVSLSNSDSTCLLIAEINALSVLNTDNDGAKHVLDYFFYRGRFFLITELLGTNLYDFYTKNIPLDHHCILISNVTTPQKIKSFSVIGIAIIARSLLLSLKGLDKLGLFHGDIKPENILTNCSNGRCDVKLIDFGSSLYICENVNNYQQTRPYRSPEMVLGLPYDTKADLWSVGALLAELWSGKLLFPSYNNATLLASIISLLGEIPQYMLYSSNTFNNNSLFFISDKYIIDLDESLEGTLVVPQKSCLFALLQTTKPHHCDDSTVEKFYDFLMLLLKLDPSLRSDPSEALKHPFLHILKRN